MDDSFRYIHAGYTYLIFLPPIALLISYKQKSLAFDEFLLALGSNLGVLSKIVSLILS